MKKTTIEFEKYNYKKELELPEYPKDMTMNDYLDLQAIEMRAIKKYSDLKPDKKDEFEYDKYMHLVSQQSNFDMVFYVLNKLDNSISKEMINSKGVLWVNTTLLNFFKDDVKDFLKGETKKNPPEKKTIEQLKKK